MTRQDTRIPVLEWVCDKCGRSGKEVARSQQLLPTMEERVARGWNTTSYICGFECLIICGTITVRPATRRSRSPR